MDQEIPPTHIDVDLGIAPEKPFQSKLPSPLVAADPLDRPKLAAWYVWALVFVVHVAYLHVERNVQATPELRIALGVKAWGFELEAPEVVDWLAVAVQVVLVMGLVGGMRPSHLGLDFRLLWPALLVLIPLLALEAIASVGARDPGEFWSSHLTRHIAGRFLDAIVFGGFFLTQIDAALGKRSWDWGGARVLWSVSVTWVIWTLADLAAEWPPGDPPANLQEILGQKLLRLPYSLFSSWVFLRSGNLFFFVFMPHRLELGELFGLGRGHLFDDFLWFDVILVATEWLRFRRSRIHRIDRALLGGLPLPARLADPLRVFRYFLTCVLVLGILVSIGSGFQEERAGFIPLLILIWLVLPARSTNAFYLRAFSADERSPEVRKAILGALGPGYRLSGIRSPKRRWPILLRSLGRIAFCFRYSSVNHMNLEADRDWLGRIWRSLGDARCAIVDVSCVTEFVAIEIRVACQALGLDRVLFIGDDSRTVAEWEALVTEHLGDLGRPSGSIHVAVWGHHRESRDRFHEEVRCFAAGLPEGVAGLSWDAFRTVRPTLYSWPRRSLQAASVSVQIVAGGFLCVVANQILRILERSSPFFAVPLFLIGFTGMSIYACMSVFAHLEDNPFPVSRRVTGLYAFLVLLYTLGISAVVLLNLK